jgi:hypothetical protein
MREVETLPELGGRRASGAELATSTGRNNTATGGDDTTQQIELDRIYRGFVIAVCCSKRSSVHCRRLPFGLMRERKVVLVWNSSAFGPVPTTAGLTMCRGTRRSRRSRRTRGINYRVVALITATTRN